MDKLDHIFTSIAQRIAFWAGQPAAFCTAFLIVVGWGFSGPLFGYSDTWQLVINTGTTIVTFLMVFLIQNAQNRDASAMQAKLDEVIRSIDGARNEFIGIEHLTDSELSKILKMIEEECSKATIDKDAKDAKSRGKGGEPASIQRLIQRR